jgi:hypothetical protein
MNAGVGVRCNAGASEDAHGEEFEPARMFLKGYPGHCHSRRTTSLETLIFQERIPMKSAQIIRILLASLILAIMAIAPAAQADPTPTPEPTPSPFPSPPTSPSPVPKLYLKGQEYYTANGKNFVRYTYDVLNKTDYPAALFAPAPNLPPCGANANSSRTWVDFFDQTGKRLYGFCALGKPADLDGIWFAMEEGVVPPSWVYIEINDRQTNTKYKSNIADTTL